MVINHFLKVKSKVNPVQKTVLFLRSSGDSLDSNAKIIDKLCKDPIANQIKKTISMVSQTNGNQGSLIRTTTVYEKQSL